MRISQFLFATLLAILFCTGCYQAVDLNVPFEGSKMVLEGYISPDKGLDLRIRKTFDPYVHTDFDENGYLVTKARAYISQDGRLIDSCQEIGKGRYLSLFPEMYRAGGVYEVWVTAPGIDDVFVDEIRIPEEPFVSTDNFTFKMHESRYSMTLTASLQNPDQYTVFIGRSWHDSRAEHPLNTSIAMDEHIIDECEGDLVYVSNKCEASPTFEAVFRATLKERSEPGKEGVFLPQSYVYFEIGQVDPRYRDYVETATASDEPFIEPKLDPGNAEGGYGFIVGWNPVSFTYRL